MRDSIIFCQLILKNVMKILNSFLKETVANSAVQRKTGRWPIISAIQLSMAAVNIYSRKFCLGINLEVSCHLKHKERSSGGKKQRKRNLCML